MSGVNDIEMNRTFNNGIGMVVVVSAEDAQAVAHAFAQSGESVHTIGRVVQRHEGACVQLTK